MNKTEVTVKPENQLQKEEFVSFEGIGQAGIRVLFLGNSITRHGIKREIGWHFDHGMAASAREKDYVHLLMAQIRSVHADASFCICQGAEWERRYWQGLALELEHDLFALQGLFALFQGCLYGELFG